MFVKIRKATHTRTIEVTKTNIEAYDKHNRVRIHLN